MIRLFAVVALLGLSSFSLAESKFRAGAFAQDITPEKLPISVNGGMRDRQAKTVHDRLHARCLVLDDGKTRIAFAVCDSCMIPREIFDEAKKIAAEKTGIPTANMLMSATHTHSAPTATGVFQSEPDKAYQKFLAKKIAEGIIKAHANLEPAEFGWGIGNDRTQVFNRRWIMKPGTVMPDPFDRGTDRVRMNPGYLRAGLIRSAGPIDPVVSVISVRTAKGTPLAILANYSLHYVGGVPPLSADYFGAFAERIKQFVTDKSNRKFVGIMSNGTSGDINNINYGAAAPLRKKPYVQCRIVADSVATVALKVYRKIKHTREVKLAMNEREIEMGVRLPTEKDLVRAKKILAAAKGPVLKSRQEIYARESVLLAKYPRMVKAKLQAIRINDLGIVSTPCETFVEIGLELREKSPLKHTFTIELANGYNGYLPTPAQHALGGYETWRARSSYLEVNASIKVVRTLIAQLYAVAAPE